MIQSKKAALLALNFALLLFGLSGVVGKMVTVTAITVVAVRVLFSSAVLGTILTVRHMEKLPRGGKHRFIAVGAGVLQGLSWVAFYTSVQGASVAIAMITFSTAPLFVALIEPVVFREKFQWKSFGFAIIAIVGVLIATPEFSMDNAATVGILWGLVSGATYAVLTIINRGLAAEYEGVQVCFWEHFVALCVTMPLALHTISAMTAMDWLLLGFVGLVCTAVAFSLLVQTQKILPTQLVALMSGIETVYGIVLAFLLIGEQPTIQQLIGGAVILGVVVVATVTSQSNPTQEGGAQPLDTHGKDTHL